VSREHPLTPLLSRWLDGRTTPKESQEVERLLASDPAAAAAVRRLREAADVLRASARRDPPVDLADRVLAEGAFHGGEIAVFRRVARRYAAAAALLLATGVAGTVWVEATAPSARMIPSPERDDVADIALSMAFDALNEEVDR
jgi:anti-sigma factor RsiW